MPTGAVVAIVVSTVVTPIALVITIIICLCYCGRNQQGSSGKLHMHVLCKIIAVHYSYITIRCIVIV